jgi:hypothetical protein
MTAGEAFSFLFVIFITLGIGALMAASVPGLTVGFLIGLFVERRDRRFIASLAFSVIGTLIVCVWRMREILVVSILVAFSALLILTSIGAWLGRKFAATAPNAQ